VDEDFQSEDFGDEELDEEALEAEEVDLDELDEEDVDEVAVEEDEEEEEVLLEDEEPDSDEVEASLDQILAERVGVAAGLDEDEDEDFDDAYPVEDRSASIGVAPKKPGEFTCRSCFLVKHPSQLADPNKMLCSDCV
jgi:hypothetical protein